jgi:hypothetical protein
VGGAVVTVSGCVTASTLRFCGRGTGAGWEIEVGLEIVVGLGIAVGFAIGVETGVAVGVAIGVAVGAGMGDCSVTAATSGAGDSVTAGFSDWAATGVGKLEGTSCSLAAEIGSGWALSAGDRWVTLGRLVGAAGARRTGAFGANFLPVLSEVHKVRDVQQLVC